MEYYITIDEQNRMLKIHNLFSQIMKNLGKKKLELLYQLIDELSEYYNDSQSSENLMYYSFKDMKELLKKELTKKNSYFHLALEMKKNHIPKEIIENFIKKHQ